MSVPIEEDWTRTSTGEWMWPRARLVACRELALAAFPTLNPMRARYGGLLSFLARMTVLVAAYPLARYCETM